MTNQKYELLNQSLKAVSKGTINLLILKGLAGIGKTYATLKYVKENDINHEYINNYATPLAFYKLIYENRNKKVIIFDDVQSIGDPKIKSMFKKWKY
jgi:predicted AAA+ superfamily ATPase